MSVRVNAYGAYIVFMHTNICVCMYVCNWYTRYFPSSHTRVSWSTNERAGRISPDEQMLPRPINVCEHSAGFLLPTFGRVSTIIPCCSEFHHNNM